MGMTAVGTMGGHGAGFGGGIGGVRQPGAVRTLDSAATSTVSTSGAAQPTLPGDGGQSGASMGELAQALIVALMLQLLQ